MPAGVKDGDADSYQYPMVVELCASLRNADAVCRSLERYGYAVLDCQSSDGDGDSRAADNYNNLMRYLDI